MEEETNYLDRLPEWPEFAVVDGNIDGLVPVCKIGSWEYFLELLKDERFRGSGHEYVFRGQHHYRWFLEPTLGRSTNGVVSEDDAEAHLRKFKLSVRGRLPDSSIVYDAEELWAIGQHHGLSTPLLDWTQAPYVALFFAFIDDDSALWVDDYENIARAVFILNKTYIEELGDVELKILEPSKDDHGRLVNQAGLFTIAPYGERLESALINSLSREGVDTDDPNVLARYLCKIYIPSGKKMRVDCLQQLHKMNIHHASLFPDIIGASNYCNALSSGLYVGGGLDDSGSQEAVVEKGGGPDGHAEKAASKSIAIEPPHYEGGVVNVEDVFKILRANAGPEIFNDHQLTSLAEQIIVRYQKSAGL
ncbi:MAG: FRG domain-containing protein, partial [Porticoccus sp.]